MGKYIILYSISLLIICVLVMIIFLYANKKKQDHTKIDVLPANEELNKYFDSLKGQAFIILDKTTKKVLETKGDFNTIFGYSANDIKNDLYLLDNKLSSEEKKKIRYLVSNWDRSNVLSFDFLFDEERIATLEIKYIDDKYISLTFKDVTREYNERKELNAKMENLVLDSKSKMNYLSNMSHEIRNPMNGIVGLIDLAKNSDCDKETLNDYLTKTESLSEHLLSLINDILDISKLESGKFVFTREIIDMSELRDKIYNMFAKQTLEKGIHYNVVLEEGSVKYIMGDELRIMQILINIVSNSVKFTPKDHEIDVKIKQISQIDNVAKFMFQISDTGEGMSKEFLSRIFNPFEQESGNTSHRHGGTGLGMAITHTLSKSMGGNVTVDSIKGEGSTFQVFLPFEIATEEEILKNKDKPIPIKKVSTSINHKILLAEDEDINALIAAKAISSLNVPLVRAKDGLEALEIFKNSEVHEFDLIIMDIQMPNMDGLESTRHIRALEREDAKNVIIVALSGNAMAEDSKKSIDAGMNYHFGKPTNYKKIIESIYTR